jgi:HSP20 family molecular chaperone IbpA
MRENLLNMTLDVCSLLYKMNVPGVEKKRMEVTIPGGIIVSIKVCEFESTPRKHIERNAESIRPDDVCVVASGTKTRVAR